MKNVNRLFDLYLIFVCCASAVAVLLRSFAFINKWDPVALRFDGSVYALSADILVTIGVIFAFSYFIFARKGANLIASSTTPLSYVPSGIVSVAILFLSIEKLANLGLGYVAQSPMLIALSVLIALCGIASTAAFFLSVFLEKNENIYKAAFGMALVLFLASLAAFVYFDSHLLPTNSPIKTTDILAYIFASAFFLFEVRISLGRAKWHAYFVFGLAALLLTSYSSIPSMVYYVAKGECINDSIYSVVLILALAIFIWAKLLVCRSLASEGACATVQIVEELAAKREAELIGNPSDESEDGESAEEEISTPDFENYTIEIPMPGASEDGFSTFGGE